MKLVDAAAINAFLTALGARQAEPAQLALLGGCALILLGSPRTTEDIDYVGDDLQRNEFQQTIEQVGSEVQLHVEPVPIERFLPLPAGSQERRVFIGVYGVVDVYVVDPYVLALSKLDRGFDADIDDIVFLVRRGVVNLDFLADLVASTLVQAAVYNIDPAAMHQHLAIVRQRASHP